MYGSGFRRKYLRGQAREDRRSRTVPAVRGSRRREFDLRAMFMKLSDHPDQIRPAMAGFQKQYEQEQAKAKAKAGRGEAEVNGWAVRQV